MKSTKVLILGSTGMLGTAVVAQLSLAGLSCIEASRTQGLKFDAERDSCEHLLLAAGLTPEDYVVNCVGLTKTQINESDPYSVERAMRLNIVFPMHLTRAAEKIGVRVIQVATDCVFSGRAGGYTETDAQDALDVYGKTKSLGEVPSENVMHLRCSLVGPELAGRRRLFFEWVRALKQEAVVDGFAHHQWNGLTSQTFGAIVSGIVQMGSFFPGVQHLVPADSVTKFELVSMELELLGRSDVTVNKTATEEKVDRTLQTVDPNRNNILFHLGGFATPPSIREMMEQLPWSELRIREK